MNLLGLEIVYIGPSYSAPPPHGGYFGVVPFIGEQTTLDLPPGAVIDYHVAPDTIIRLVKTP